MAKEIERKFLVKPGFKPKGKGVRIIQGYLPTKPGFTARVRLAGSKAFLTLKGPSKGLIRDEYEYPIPAKDAKELLTRHCGAAIIEKTRYRVPFGGKTWEVDLFEGANKALRLAELELPRADTTFEVPNWVWAEVTGDRRFDNSHLAVAPYKPFKEKLAALKPKAKGPEQITLF
jgi:adenylate cyclase